MTAGLAAETWYEHVAPAVTPRPPLDGRIETETCVVGGGLAGLSTALSLAERGRPVALLEAGRIGGGASGRNGGMVSAGFNRGFEWLRATVGHDAAEAFYRLSLEGMALLRRRIESRRMDCALVEGVIEASWFADGSTIASRIEPLNRLGARLEPWSGSACALPIARAAFVAAFSTATASTSIR